MQRYYDIDYIKCANKTRGYHFFDAATMRFFRSRVSDTVYQGPGGIYFVTSEQFVSSSGDKACRSYTIRQFNPETGDIKTAGEFNKLTRHSAHKTAAELSRG